VKHYFSVVRYSTATVTLDCRLIASHHLWENLRTQDQAPISSTICWCVDAHTTVWDWSYDWLHKYWCDLIRDTLRTIV